MEKLTKFPLFRLPFIPLKKVLRLMDVCEQYEMANVSKKAEKLVTLCLSRDVYAVTFSFGQILSIEIRNDKTGSSIKVEIDYPAPEEYIGMESIRSHIEFLKKVFHLEVIELRFDTSRPPGLESRLIPIFKEYLVISRLDIDPVTAGQTNDELYLYILNECCNCSCLYIFIETTAEFKLTASECPKFSCDELALDLAHWVTVDHLATSFVNVKSLIIGGTLFNSEEANKFIKSWMSGSQIEGFILGVEDDIRFREVFRNIDAVEIREALVSSRVVRYEEGTTFVVKQTDGKEAIVYETTGLLFLETAFSRDIGSNSEEFQENVEDDAEIEI